MRQGNRVRTDCKVLCRFGAVLTIAVSFHVSSAMADAIIFDGEVTDCTAACSGFGAVDAPGSGSPSPVNSSFYGYLFVEFDDAGEFEIGPLPFTSFNFEIENDGAAIVDEIYGPHPTCPEPNEPLQLCNAAVANPWHLFPSLAEIEGAGQASADGSFSSGTVQIVITSEPFARNDAKFVLDLQNGTGHLVLLDGAIQVAEISMDVTAISDSDGDGIDDDQDNCILRSNPAQIDVGDDGYGNACDLDYNDDCIVNVQDLGLLKAAFFGTDPYYDVNGDGVVGTIELGQIRSQFLSPPGPSAFASCGSHFEINFEVQ